jgi:C4-type Zn-finger protein
MGLVRVGLCAPLTKKTTAIRYCPSCGFRFNVNDMYVYTNTDIRHHKDRGCVVYICNKCRTKYRTNNTYIYNKYTGFDFINASNASDYGCTVPNSPDKTIRYEIYKTKLQDTVCNCRY